MAQAVIVHTFQDAKHCIRNELYKNMHLFSTDVNVSSYLKYKYHIKCEYLLSYTDPKKTIEVSEKTLSLNESLLAELDQLISPKFNQILGLNLSYFKVLYSPIAAWLLQVYLCIDDCIKKMVEDYSIEKVWIYEAPMGLLSSSQINKFIKRISNNINFFTITYKISEETDTTQINGIEINEVEKLLNQHYPADFFLKRKGNGSQNVFLFESLSIWPFFQNITEINIYGLQLNNSAMYSYRLKDNIFPRRSVLKTIKVASNDIKQFLTLLYDDICEDFCLNIIQYLQQLFCYRKLHEQVLIQNVCWQIPPLVGANALILGYFMTNQFSRVIGIQSKFGWVVGQVDFPHFERGILGRCHYYLTEGVTNECFEGWEYKDLAKVQFISPNNFLNAAISSESLDTQKQSVDIAIYLRPTFSFLHTGEVMAHVNLHEPLLLYLEQQKKKVQLIANKGLSLNNFALFSQIKHLKNIDIIEIEDNNLGMYFEKNKPNLFIWDLIMPVPTSLFFEEVTIIAISDIEYPFINLKALSEFQKTVYFVEKFEEIKNLIKQYYEGYLEKKTDKTYARMFRNEAGVYQNLLRFINK